MICKQNTCLDTAMQVPLYESNLFQGKWMKIRASIYTKDFLRLWIICDMQALFVSLIMQNQVIQPWTRWMQTIGINATIFPLTALVIGLCIYTLHFLINRIVLPLTALVIGINATIFLVHLEPQVHRSWWSILHINHDYNLLGHAPLHLLTSLK